MIYARLTFQYESLSTIKKKHFLDYLLFMIIYWFLFTNNNLKFE